MKEQAALRLCLGHTVHQRSVPFAHRFKYGLSLIDIDIDRLDEAAQKSVLFSVDTPGLFSFNRKDHGDRTDTPLRPWAICHFEDANIDLEGGAIRLITFARHAFYKFAPISLWLGHGPDGDLRGILYEVNNTFGETHIYIAATPSAGRSQHTADKVFHVSPFFDISGQYRFTLRSDARQLSLIVETLSDQTRTHMATIKTRRQPANSGAFLRLALTKPLSSLAVSVAIHWQALKLWLKGARYHSRPALPEAASTLAKPEHKTSLTETAA